MIKTENLRSSYKFYKDNNPNPVDVKIYLKIVLGYIKFIMQKVYSGQDVQLSGGNSLGSIGVRGNKVVPTLNEKGDIVGLAPDWKKTIALWNENPEAKERKEKVYCFNEHTNGIRYRLVWHKARMILPNKSLYMLTFSRDNKRELVRLLKEENREFVEKL